MAIYIALLIILIITYVVFSSNGLQVVAGDSKRKVAPYYFIVILFIIIQSLRANTVGGDVYDSYARYYVFFGSMDWKTVFAYTNHEIGYVIYNKIIYSLSNGNIQVFLFSISLVYHIALSRIIIKYSKNIYLSLFLYFASSGFNSSMNTLRSVLALSIIMFALPSLIERKKLGFLIGIFIAFLFHQTSICFLFLYVSLLLKDWKKIIVFNILAAAFFAVGINYIVPLINKWLPRYSVYTSFYSAQQSGGGEFLLSLILTICLAVLVLGKRDLYKDDTYVVFFIMLICAGSLQVFTLWIHQFSRVVSEYTIMSIPILLPYFCLNNKFTYNSRPLVNWIILLGYSALYINSLFQNSTMTVPYQFFFQ